jgi:hypothetical protein
MKIIIGTGLGHVYETLLNLGGNDFFFNLLYKIEPSAVVSSIYLQTAGQKQIGENTFFVLLVSMSSRPCVYRFCGGATLYSCVFNMINSSECFYAQLRVTLRTFSIKKCGTILRVTAIFR